jgi:hypothetical protein
MRYLFAEAAETLANANLLWVQAALGAKSDRTRLAAVVEADVLLDSLLRKDVAELHRQCKKLIKRLDNSGAS